MPNGVGACEEEGSECSRWSILLWRSSSRGRLNTGEESSRFSIRRTASTALTTLSSKWLAGRNDGGGSSRRRTGLNVFKIMPKNARSLPFRIPPASLRLFMDPLGWPRPSRRASRLRGTEVRVRRVVPARCAHPFSLLSRWGVRPRAPGDVFLHLKTKTETFSRDDSGTRETYPLKNGFPHANFLRELRILEHALLLRFNEVLLARHCLNGKRFRVTSIAFFTASEISSDGYATKVFPFKNERLLPQIWDELGKFATKTSKSALL